jgi:hypothetical protein
MAELYGWEERTAIAFFGAWTPMYWDSLTAALPFVVFSTRRELPMSRYSALPEHIRIRLSGIEPSRDGELIYHPIRAALKSGEVLDTVYIVPAERPYLKYWGVYPEADKGKRWVRIEDVVEVEDSPTRLPARFADEIYRQGESGMGYTIFTVVSLADRRKRV